MALGRAGVHGKAELVPSHVISRVESTQERVAKDPHVIILGQYTNEAVVVLNDCVILWEHLEPIVAKVKLDRW